MLFNNEVMTIINEAEKQIAEQKSDRAEITFYNQNKVISAMQKNSLSERHFLTTTGYGYDDDGRDTCEKIFADIFNAQKALVRGQIVSGTHAISLVLTGLLRPGDEILSVTGEPYDTVRYTIGYDNYDKYSGSLKEFGITFKHIAFTPEGKVDIEKIPLFINSKTKLVYIQRSTGYSDRCAVDIEIIKKIVETVKSASKDVYIFCDNCYGEFLEKLEPTDVGVDVIAGSMIKNPGGGLAQTGGYIIGSEKCIDLIAARLSAPGIAYEVGSNLGLIRSFLQGVFIAPSVTSAAVCGAILASKVFEDCNYRVFPRYNEKRSDIVQAIELGSRKKTEAFCRGIQSASPVDSFVTPLAWEMPGYEEQVIMAAGNFISGSSIELSADSPMRPPYIVYMQGGLTYEHAKIGVAGALTELMK